ncbi:hypothetical protein BJ973_004621 [Actinoplanes tereljensis]|uniref:Immunity protein Imm1 n=1 Tax=Paractinoplanes tereljensis TaxID=571912 RepID=A0A919NRV8_9ACTN|nr:Imm1 family immunity protein [Actinoplanes tereljensis]GIF24009.1 hypothetical protein Ate02nite_67390 [Actinoplanes tereljensis]
MTEIVWGGGAGESAFVTAASVRSVLVELDRSAVAFPFIAEVVIENGDSLGIALGRVKSVLNFVSASKKPPYLASEGRSPAAGDGVVRFDYFGSATEFPSWQEIPMSDAMDAVCNFVATGVRPDSVAWTEV